MSKKSKGQNFSENFRRQNVKNNPQTQRFPEQGDPREERAHRGPREQREQSYDPHFAPDHDVIEVRAYQLYLERGGDPLDNWLEAERTLKQEAGNNPQVA